MTTHPSGRLDQLIHQRTRLGVMTVLGEVSTSDFTLLRDTLELSDGNLSRHLSVLEDAGYVTIVKGYRGRRPHTAISATEDGRAALEGYLADLEALIDQARPGRVASSPSVDTAADTASSSSSIPASDGTAK